MKRWQRSVVWGVLAVAVAGVALPLVGQVTTGPAGGAGAASPGTSESIRHYLKAKELFDQEKYREAQVEVEMAIQLDPKLQDAKLLQHRINSRLAEAATSPGPGKVPATGPKVGEKGDLLSAEQISRIRLFEMKKDETGVRGNIPRKTLEDFWATVILKSDSVPDNRKGDADRRAFLAANFPQQLQRIREQDAVKFYDKINVLSDPAVMVEFRQKIQPYLIQNCATSGCHSGATPNGYRIYGTPGAALNDRETYTNFYNLTQYAKGGGKMLDRDEPEKSLFLQYALPKENATYPHPGKAEVRTRLASTTNPRYQEMVKWVKSLAFPAPNYGISRAAATTTAPAK